MRDSVEFALRNEAGAAVGEPSCRIGQTFVAGSRPAEHCITSTVVSNTHDSVLWFSQLFQDSGIAPCTTQTVEVGCLTALRITSGNPISCHQIGSPRHIPSFGLRSVWRTDPLEVLLLRGSGGSPNACCCWSSKQKAGTAHTYQDF